MAVWKLGWRVTDGESMKSIAMVQKMNDANLNSVVVGIKHRWSISEILSKISCLRIISDLGKGSFSVLMGMEDTFHSSSTAAEITGIVEAVITSSQIWLLIRSTRRTSEKYRLCWVNSTPTESVTMSQAQEPLFWQVPFSKSYTKIHIFALGDAGMNQSLKYI